MSQSAVPCRFLAHRPQLSRRVDIVTAAALLPGQDDAAVLALVDDDDALREEIAGYLRSHGFVVVDAPDIVGLEGLLARHTVQLIILDLMLPGEDGLTACKRLSRRGGPPILMLSAMADDVDRILGLELGADDYLGKPVNPRELLARVRAMLRRRPLPDVTLQQGYQFVGFRLELARRRLTAPDGSTIMLTPGEFSLLTVLLQHPARVLSRDQLLDHARGEGAEVFDRAIDVQISRLRRKLQGATGGRDHPHSPRTWLHARRQGDCRSEAAAPPLRTSPSAALAATAACRSPPRCLLLLLAGLLAAQVATVTIALLLPPRRPPAFRLEDIAAALRGGPLPRAGGETLVRTRQTRPPAATGAGWITLERTREDLARRLDAPLSAVQVQFFLAPPFAGSPPIAAAGAAQPRKSPHGRSAAPRPPPDREGSPSAPPYGSLRAS